MQLPKQLQYYMFIIPMKLEEYKANKKYGINISLDDNIYVNMYVQTVVNSSTYSWIWMPLYLKMT